MTIKTADFLVEIGTEELPPKALKTLSQAFCDGVKAGLVDAELAFGDVKAYASPRRLAVLVEQLQTKQIDKMVERKGPAKKAAFDANGEPTKALLGFAKGCGAAVADLSEIETDKGIWMVYHLEQKGQAASELLPSMIDQALAKLPIPKRMRWGNSEVEFVRPVHWVLMLLGEQVVPATVLGHTASNQTYGHRFHAPQAMTIQQPADYVTALKQQGYVQADFEERKASIRQQVEAAAQGVGGIAEIDEALLDEVTGLNEWPIAVVGDFDESFLAVPSEALISAMKGHQKYFHILDASGQLMAKFITLANIESVNPESVKKGNERVIRPRLSDATFFWTQDRKQPLEDFLPRLKTVVFQQKLGTLYDKTERLETLAVKIGRPLGESAEILERAARLSKCDLMSEMVGEFPELQGVMGRYYAQAQHEDQRVAEAIDGQYQPRFAGDDLPASTVSQALAIADKLDTITGIYGIGQLPTGDKDPFALRRSALGLVRIMIEKELDLDLQLMVRFSLDLHVDIPTTDDVVMEIVEFIISRLKAYYVAQGVSVEQYEAVRVCAPSNPLDFDKRIDAVRQFSEMAEADSLSAANKRIANILKKVDEAIPEEVTPSLFENEAEQDLFATLDALRESVSMQLAERNYAEALRSLAKIRQPVDAFFDGVMVMAEDKAVKLNRLALLNQIYQLFRQIADISRL